MLKVISGSAFTVEFDPSNAGIVKLFSPREETMTNLLSGETSISADLVPAGTEVPGPWVGMSKICMNSGRPSPL